MPEEPTTPIYASLHWREKEFVDQLINDPDAHDAAIAKRMGLATHTAKMYLGRAMERYGVRTRTGLAVRRLMEMWESWGN